MLPESAVYAGLQHIHRSPHHSHLRRQRNAWIIMQSRTLGFPLAVEVHFPAGSTLGQGRMAIVRLRLSFCHTRYGRSSCQWASSGSVNQPLPTKRCSAWSQIEVWCLLWHLRHPILLLHSLARWWGPIQLKHRRCVAEDFFRSSFTTNVLQSEHAGWLSRFVTRISRAVQLRTLCTTVFF